MKRILLFITIVFALIFTANAQRYEWVGGNGGSNGWENPNNWENELGQPGVPVYGADVYIGGNGVFLYYDPQFAERFSSITVYNNAILSTNTPITVTNKFTLEKFSTLELYLEDVNNTGDGMIEVTQGTYDIDGYIVPKFIGTSFVPQIDDQITVVTAPGPGNLCGIFTMGNAIFYDNSISMFEVAFNVLCTSPNKMVVKVHSINYTGAKSWDGAGGNGLWSDPTNWDPNGVPTPDDFVIINKNGGATVSTGEVIQDRLTIGRENKLTVTGNIKVSNSVKINEKGSLAWSAGTLRKRLAADYSPRINNDGTLTVSGISIDDLGIIVNDEAGVIEMNGNINLNNGEILNLSGARININRDNISIGYTSGTKHKLRSFSATIEKTVTSGSGTSFINLTEFENGYKGILRSAKGTLSIGGNFNNTGTMTGSGSFSYPVGFVNSGIISPGSSPGTLTVIGDLTTSNTATFDIEIDGPTAGTQYDQIIVTDNAILEGTINVTLGYLPANNSSFQILKADTLTSCNFPSQIFASFGGTSFMFNMYCQNNILYLNGPVTLSAEKSEIQDVAIYPNPVKDVLNVTSSSILKGHWQLINQIGQVVKEADYISNEFKISLNNMSSGLYFFKLEDVDLNATITKKIMISN